MRDNKTVLLIEDNGKLNDANSRALKLCGYDVLTAMSLEQARKVLEECEPDVILLDVMLPDGSGFDFCSEIRAQTSAHILFLTAKTAHEDMVRGLTGGGDDYITKPFHPEELIARVGAAMRRRQIDVSASLLTKGALTLDIVAAQAKLNGKDLLLSPKEFALLLLLVQNEKRTLSAEYIYEKVWGQPMVSDTQALGSAVKRLRKKLAGCGYTISATYGKGYCFERGVS